MVCTVQLINKTLYLPDFLNSILKRGVNKPIYATYEYRYIYRERERDELRKLNILPNHDRDQCGFKMHKRIVVLCCCFF